jgi:hypothetical protein
MKTIIAKKIACFLFYRPNYPNQFQLDTFLRRKYFFIGPLALWHDLLSRND